MKLLFAELALVGEVLVSACVCVRPDLLPESMDSSFRCSCRGGKLRARGEMRGSLIGPEGSDDDQSYSCASENNRQHSSSAALDANLPGTYSSSAGEGKEMRLSKGRRSGINRTSRARMLLPNGRRPHIRPCQCGGI